MKRIIWGIWKAASRYSGIEKKKDDMREKWQWKAHEDKKQDSGQHVKNMTTEKCGQSREEFGECMWVKVRPS